MGYPFYFPVMNNPAKRLTKTCLLAAHQKKRAVGPKLESSMAGRDSSRWPMTLEFTSKSCEKCECTYDEDWSSK
jgi:hypothetical protein